MTTYTLIAATIQRDVTMRYAGHMQDAARVVAQLAADAADSAIGETEYLRQARKGLLAAGAPHSLIVQFDNYRHLIVLAKD